MAFEALEGSGLGGAFVVDVDKWGQPEAELVRTNFNDHETRLADVESATTSTDLDATNLTSGTIPAGRFPVELPGVSGVNLTNLNASNLASGTVPAARMPALTGDVTTSAGAVAATIANDAVTYAKIQNITGNRLLGRVGTTGDAQEISIGSGLALDGSGLRVTAAAGGTPALDDLTDVVITAPTTDEVLSYNGSAWVNAAAGSSSIADGSVTYAKIQDVSAANKLLGRGSAGGSGDVQEVSLGLGLTMSGTTLSADGGGVGSGAPYYTVIATYTDADIRGWFASPITIIAAPGPGKVIVPIQATWSTDFTAGAYAQNVQIAFYYNGTVGPKLPFSGVTNSTTKQIVQTMPTTAGTNTESQIANTPLTVSNSGGALTGGNAANQIKVTLHYTIVDVL